MIIVEKNKGKKISYRTNNGKITFDDDLTINLNKREKDWAVHIDVCYDQNEELVVGAAAGRKYVAEIDIPERKYREISVVKEYEEVTEYEPIPLDMETVTLSLWSIEEE